MCAAGTGTLVFYVMQSRMEVLLSRQREELAAAKAALKAQKKELSSQKKALTAQKKSLDNSLKYLEESVRRKAMDDFLTEIRVEERHYIREDASLPSPRRSRIRQERVYFRNIPLSNWVEHEMPIEEGADSEKPSQTVASAASDDIRGKIKLLR
jgi:multidrug efflux pump subunit AcrA (membrane-fusion protein)